MTGRETVEELQQVEAECLRRFRKRAAELQAANPAMPPSVCFTRAVQMLRETSDRYQFARSVLQGRGYAAQPLR